MTDDRFDPKKPHPPNRAPDGPRPVLPHHIAGPAAESGEGTSLHHLGVVSSDDLLRFVDGGLDDDGRVQVLTNLAARPAAVERVEAYLHQNARLRSLREHLPVADSADFAAPLQAALVASLRRRHARNQWRRWGVAAAVALAVVGGAIGFSVAPWRDPSPATGGMQTASTSQQPYFLFDKPELATLAPTVAASDTAPDHAAFEWLAGKLSEFSLQAPDFAQIGLELVGGETKERHGMPAIRLIYRDEAANPVLFHVGIGKPDADHAFWLVREGFVSLQWRRGPMVFVVVAPADSPQLSEVVGIVGAAVARLPADEPGAEPETPAERDAAAAASDPVQAIAVPIEPLAPAQGQAGEAEDHAPADPALEATDENEPESL